MLNLTLSNDQMNITPQAMGIDHFPGLWENGDFNADQTLRRVKVLGISLCGCYELFL